MPAGRGVPERLERVVCRLGAGFGGDELAEYVVDPREYGLGAAEIGSQDELLADPLLRLEVGGDVGAAEPVDRLFRVTDQEQTALRHGHVFPAGRAAVRAGRDPDGELDLDRVGVLELIEQQPPVTLLQAGPDGRAMHGTAEQVTGEHEKVVELELPLGPPFLRGLKRRGSDTAGQPAQRRVHDTGAQCGGPRRDLARTRP